MSKRKKETRKPIQISGFTHKVLKALSLMHGEPIGKIVDKVIKHNYPEMYKAAGK